MQSEIAQIVKERDGYFLRVASLESRAAAQESQADSLKGEVAQAGKDAQRYLQEKTELQQQFIEEKDRAFALKQESLRLEALLKLQERDLEVKQGEVDRLREAERLARDELAALKAQDLSAASSASSAQEMVSALLKQQSDELQLSAQVANLRVELRERDFRLQELQGQLALKERELQLAGERAAETARLREAEAAQKEARWEKERRALGEHGAASRRMAENMQREQRYMS